MSDREDTDHEREHRRDRNRERDDDPGVPDGADRTGAPDDPVAPGSPDEAATGADDAGEGETEGEGEGETEGEGEGEGGEPTGEFEEAPADEGAERDAVDDEAVPFREPDAREPGRGDRIRVVLLWAALFVLGLLALVALFQFYLNASAAIDRWIAPEYRRIMQAAFNLLVLLLSGIGIAAIVRELSE